jgi:hypothetical protein
MRPETIGICGGGSDGVSINVVDAFGIGSAAADVWITEFHGR